MWTLMPLCWKGSIPHQPYTMPYPNKYVCFVHRLFPNDDPTHVNVDALMPEGPSSFQGQHTSASLLQGLTASPTADAQPQTSPSPEVLQVPPNAAVYSRLLAVIKPYAENQQKWDVWAEDEDDSSMTEEDAQVLDRILCFCMNVGGVNGCHSVPMDSVAEPTYILIDIAIADKSWTFFGSWC